MSLKKSCLIIWLSLFPMGCSETPVETAPTVTQTHLPLVATTPQSSAETPAPVTPPTPIAELPALMTALPDEVKGVLNAMKLSEDGLSVYIQSLDNPAPLLAFNADVPRNPASVMKLITTYAALGILGADYRWPIELYTTGQVAGDTIQGDLILKGYGDPNFKEADLRALLEILTDNGIKKVTGNLVIDNTHFSIVKQDTGAFDGKRYAAYNAQSDALLYNEGVSDFIVRGGEVTVPNPAVNVSIVNKINAKSVACSKRYAYPRVGVKEGESQVSVIFEGNYSSRCGERRYSFVITDAPSMLYATAAKIWMEDLGGTIEGTDFAIAPTPATAQLLARVESEPVSEVLPMINKKSNNVMAQQVFLSLGAKQKGAGDTTEKSYQAIQQWFKSRGLDFPELQMENGSGLSRNGQVSARHIAYLLRDAYQHPQRDIFIDSLPIMGVDGTLRHRMRGTSVAGHGHLKTGTLNNAKALAGYVTTAEGETYIVSILHNDPQAKYRASPVHDKLVAWVAQQKPQKATAQSAYVE